MRHRELRARRRGVSQVRRSGRKGQSGRLTHFGLLRAELGGESEGGERAEAREREVRKRKQRPADRELEGGRARRRRTDTPRTPLSSRRASPVRAARLLYGQQQGARHSRAISRVERRVDQSNSKKRGGGRGARRPVVGGASRPCSEPKAALVLCAIRPCCSASLREAKRSSRKRRSTRRAGRLALPVMPQSRKRPAERAQHSSSRSAQVEQGEAEAAGASESLRRSDEDESEPSTFDTLAEQHHEHRQQALILPAPLLQRRTGPRRPSPPTPPSQLSSLDPTSPGPQPRARAAQTALQDELCILRCVHLLLSSCTSGCRRQGSGVGHPRSSRVGARPQSRTQLVRALAAQRWPDEPRWAERLLRRASAVKRTAPSSSQLPIHRATSHSRAQPRADPLDAPRRTATSFVGCPRRRACSRAAHQPRQTLPHRSLPPTRATRCHPPP